jgi:hypothetical protein
VTDTPRSSRERASGTGNDEGEAASGASKAARSVRTLSPARHAVRSWTRHARETNAVVVVRRVPMV